MPVVVWCEMFDCALMSPYAAKVLRAVRAPHNLKLGCGLRWELVTKMFGIDVMKDVFGRYVNATRHNRAQERGMRTRWVNALLCRLLVML